jgi:hypothetical protein
MPAASATKDAAVHTVIFNNDRYSRVCGGMRVNGPVRFVAFVDLTAKGKANPELREVYLTPGGPTHNLTGEQLETLRKSEKGQELLDAGVLQIISPENPDEASGTTSDHDDLTALSLIRDSEDREWLETSLQQEKRPAVRDAIKKQMDAIDSRMAALSKRAAAIE